MNQNKTEVENEHGEPYGVSLRSAGEYTNYLPVGVIIQHTQDELWTISDGSKTVLGTNLYDALREWYKDIPHPPSMYMDYPTGWAS